MISEATIQKVKEQNDIVDVISESVRLKKSGRNYSGLCPFHHEKTPSFSVSQDKQIYKCFGCGEAGNVITFVMKYRNLGFTEALKLLAERANIQIEEEGQKTVRKDPYEKLYKINTEAARFFYKNLQGSKSSKSYFLGRGITEGTIRRFGLGYALDNWVTLLKYLKGKGYSELDMLNAGLIIRNEKGNYYDRFRNRVMFPVFDSRGRVIGFGGRVLDDSKPKYLNSPETAVFKKGTNLYGLNFSIKNKIEDRTIIIVEGYMDCISLHQYGITNVVASLGTALTINQAKLLKRYVDKVIISYDADLAGQSATIRGLQILKGEGFDVRVLTVPQGKDPDEYIRSNGREAFLKLIDNALPLIDYKIKRAKEGIDLNNHEMVISFIKNAAEIISDLNPVEKDIYIKQISEEAGIKEQAIYDLISDNIHKNSSNMQDVNTLDNFGQKLYVEPSYIKAERSILRLMHDEKDAYDAIIKTISKDQFIMESHKKIFDLIRDNIDLDLKERQNRIELNCDNIESSKEWTHILEMELIYEDEDFEKLILDFTKEIKKYRLEESKKEIMNKIKQCELNGLMDESLKLAQELIYIQKELGRL